MDEVLEKSVPPQPEEDTGDDERLELLAEELREAIRRKLAASEAATA